MTRKAHVQAKEEEEKTLGGKLLHNLISPSGQVGCSHVPGIDVTSNIQVQLIMIGGLVTKMQGGLNGRQVIEKACYVRKIVQTMHGG